MSIAVVTWPINDVGGINSWCKNFLTGLNLLGIESKTYYGTGQTRFGCDPDQELTKARYSILKAEHLSFRPEAVKSSIRELNRHSLIVMMHPSPHPTKANQKFEWSKNWMKFYRDTKPPKLVIFHDMNWEKTNHWMAEVSDSVGAALAAQHLFIRSVNNYPSDCPKKWEYFPLDLRMANRLINVCTKRNRGILCTQWIKLKNHAKFLPQLPRVEVPMRLYGNGQEYYTLRPTFDECIRVDHTTGAIHNRKSRHSFYGFVRYDEILKAMAECLFSIDLSIKGHTNMTHWEPLTVDTLSLIERRVVEHPDNEIPEDCCVAFDLERAYETINGLKKTVIENRKIVERARKFVAKAECTRVVRRILNWLKREGVCGEAL